MYKDQVEGQKKKWPLPVIIKGEEEYKVEKILNKRKFRGKNRYLVQQKGYTVEEDTWEPRENLGMQRTWWKGSKKNIERNQDKQEQKTIENYQGGIQQKCCMGRMIRGLIRNIGNN